MLSVVRRVLLICFLQGVVSVWFYVDGSTSLGRTMILYSVHVMSLGGFGVELLVG